MDSTKHGKGIINNQRGFTLIELVMVIVILGILAVVAIPKYADIQTEARVATANGVYGAALGATAINFAAGLVGATQPAGGVISDGATLLAGLDGAPEGWTTTGAILCSNGIPSEVLTNCTGTTYQITVTAAETATAKAAIDKNF